MRQCFPWPPNVASDGSKANLVQRTHQSVVEDGVGMQADPEEDNVLSELEALIRQARQLERKQQLETQTSVSDVPYDASENR
ncbi:hypothetical protein AMC90_PD00868 (plasmid) [Rhizobium phaseoli]|nr:hypothetical protein AMC90_PD00868 [Rhizobium phaseoli]ARM16167.1 hypothetical protein Bra5_PD00625 [Rhizobium phaseoli Brasil 5]